MIMSNLIRSLEQAHHTGVVFELDELIRGRHYRVDMRIQEGDKSRVQSFRGVLIRVHRAGLRSTFTLRKLSRGVGVERTWPIVSPDVVAMSHLTEGKLGYHVRRARLR